MLFFHVKSEIIFCSYVTVILRKDTAPVCHIISGLQFAIFGSEQSDKKRGVYSDYSSAKMKELKQDMLQWRNDEANSGANHFSCNSTSGCFTSHIS